MRAAVAHARDQVAAAHEAMPVDPGTSDMPGHVTNEVAQATRSTVVELHTGVPWTDFKEAVLKLKGVEDVVTPAQLADSTHVAAGTIADGIKDVWKALQTKWTPILMLLQNMPNSSRWPELETFTIY